MGWDETPPSARRLYRTAEKNARARRMEFVLSRDEFAALWIAADGRCELTTIAFDDGKSAANKWRRNPWGASLDRRDNNLGYAADNCRLICACVNIAMNEWGDKVLMRMAQGLTGLLPAPHFMSRTNNGMARGVSRVFRNGRHRYRVRIKVDGVMRDFGMFDTQEEALKVLDANKNSHSKQAELQGLQATHPSASVSSYVSCS